MPNKTTCRTFTKENYLNKQIKILVNQRLLNLKVSLIWKFNLTLLCVSSFEQCNLRVTGLYLLF